MSNNQETLDKIEKPKKKKDKSYYLNRTIIYLVCMLGGSLIYIAFLSEAVLNPFLDAFIFTAVAIIVAVPIEAFRKYRRSRKNKENPPEEQDDPLWFHVIESALSLLILILALSLILKL